MSFTNYVGIAGVGPDAALLEKAHPRAGFFGHERTIRLKDITDGTEQTIVVMETSRDLGCWTAASTPTLRELDPMQTDYLGISKPFGIKHQRDRFVQSATVGSNVAFADGHVQFLSAGIDPELLRGLATIAEGRPVQQP